MTTRTEPAAATSSFHAAAFLVQELITLSNEVERELARHLGINLTDYRALTKLATMGESTVGALGSALGASPATTTAVLNRLESRGYIARERGGMDRRQVSIRVTPAVFGEIMRLMGPVMQRTNDYVTSRPETERAAIEAFLRTTNDEIRAQLADLAAERPAHD